MTRASALRLAYLLLVGWWASAAWILGAWLVLLTPLGLDRGARMINHLPRVLLRGRAPRQPGVVVLSPAAAQRDWRWRLLYGLTVGWWLSLLCAALAWLACITILGLPLGLVLLSYLPTIANLQRTE